jgi:hypothetical protein
LIGREYRPFRQSGNILRQLIKPKNCFIFWIEKVTLRIVYCCSLDRSPINILKLTGDLIKIKTQALYKIKMFPTKTYITFFLGFGFISHES